MSAIDILNKNPSLVTTFNPAARQAGEFIRVTNTPVKSNKIITGSGGGSGKATNLKDADNGNTTPAPPDPDVPRPPNFLEWIFPPAGIYDLLFGQKDLQTGLPGAENPAYTTWQDTFIPGDGNTKTPTESTTDTILGSVSTIATIAVPLVLLGLVGSALGSFKGLFK